MTAKSNAERLAEIPAKLEAARQMISALCKPRYTEGHRDWIMSIPARPNHDPDIVIGEALREIPFLLARYDELARLAKAQQTLRRESGQENTTVDDEIDRHLQENSHER